MFMSRLTASLFSAVLVATIVACGAADPGWPPEQTNFDLIPVPISTEIVVGSNRMLFNILDKQNQSIASPDRPVELKFYDFSTSKTSPATTMPGTFMPTVEGRPGLYRAQVDLTKAGDWGVEAISTESDGTKRSGRFV